MKKAQGLPLNLIVIGALALLVLLILGGVVLFGGNIAQDITVFTPEELEVRRAELANTCQSKCRSTGSVVGSSFSGMTEGKMKALAEFCCYGSDVDGDAEIEIDELCRETYTTCRIAGSVPAAACAQRTVDSVIYDFSREYSTTTACGGSAAYCCGNLPATW